VSDEEKAKLFNQYFNSVFTDSTITLPYNMGEVSTPSNNITDISLSLEDIYEELRSLHTSKAVSPGNIEPIILNSCADSLTTPYNIFFHCL